VRAKLHNFFRASAIQASFMAFGLSKFLDFFFDTFFCIKTKESKVLGRQSRPQ